MNMADLSSQATSFVDIDRPLFQPSPPLLEFSGFSDFIAVEATLMLRNMDKVGVGRSLGPARCGLISLLPAQVARRIKVEPIDSPYFKLSVPTTVRGKPTIDSRVAPGMEVLYKITFTPRERTRDYNYDLICVTEREKFVVPIRATGAKAALSLPEALSFGSVAVKNSVTKALVVRPCP